METETEEIKDLKVKSNIYLSFETGEKINIHVTSDIIFITVYNNDKKKNIELTGFENISYDLKRLISDGDKLEKKNVKIKLE